MDFHRFGLEGLAFAAGPLERVPYCVRVLAENVVRNVGRNGVTPADVDRLSAWTPGQGNTTEVPFHPARILMQDYTGIASLVDLAALRDAMANLGGRPERINPQIPVDLVIDHSMMVDVAGRKDAAEQNLAREYARNAERFGLAKWAQGAFENLRVVPPGNGILHQVNIERIAQVVRTAVVQGRTVAFPDTMLGTDSHSTMVNGIGVLGWGVGGIEAEAAMLGLPVVVALERVVGVKVSGALREGVTATDLVLTLARMLRGFGVVDAFVEFHGPALASLTVADRVTIANMAPEYGSTCAFFPVDRQTLDYLALTGRDAEHIDLVETYAKAQGLWCDATTPAPAYTAVIELDLDGIEPTVSGPRRPHDSHPLAKAPASFREGMKVAAPVKRESLAEGSVVIAAITSCTNTSNPAGMLAAGLVARNAVRRGLAPKPWVKTSLTPGSRVVAAYLQKSGLQADLDALGFHVAGFGCATCGGNSGELDEPVASEIRAKNLTVAAVLSGNRNFEARIHPLARAAYLMSPALVVAYALAGHMGIDLTREAIGTDREGRPVFLADLWPTSADIAAASAGAVSADLFREAYGSLFEGGDRWEKLATAKGLRFGWDGASTYIRRPPYLDNFSMEAPQVGDILGARPLAILGDSVTTDHISPVGAIAKGSPAAAHLEARNVVAVDFNAYGSRRANHEIMVRGTFANIRLENEMAGGREGGHTTHQPSGEAMTIFAAAERYEAEGVPLVVVAGREYGTGSSRDWAAKGTMLLGVRAVIAESFERIHRANLVAMGILPLQFARDNRRTLALDGTERIHLTGLDAIRPRSELNAVVERADGSRVTVPLVCRIDTASEAEVWRAGGMMPFVLRRLSREPSREIA